MHSHLFRPVFADHFVFVSNSRTPLLLSTECPEPAQSLCPLRLFILEAFLVGELSTSSSVRTDFLPEISLLLFLFVALPLPSFPAVLVDANCEFDKVLLVSTSLPLIEGAGAL